MKERVSDSGGLFKNDSVDYSIRKKYSHLFNSIKEKFFDILNLAYTISFFENTHPSLTLLFSE